MAYSDPNVPSLAVSFSFVRLFCWSQIALNVEFVEIKMDHYWAVVIFLKT